MPFSSGPPGKTTGVLQVKPVVPLLSFVQPARRGTWVEMCVRGFRVTASIPLPQGGRLVASNMGPEEVFSRWNRYVGLVLSPVCSLVLLWGGGIDVLTYSESARCLRGRGEREEWRVLVVILQVKGCGNGESRRAVRKERRVPEASAGRECHAFLSARSRAEVSLMAGSAEGISVIREQEGKRPVMCLEWNDEFSLSAGPGEDGRAGRENLS